MKLYEIKRSFGTEFGIKLATDSAGKSVMEYKIVEVSSSMSDEVLTLVADTDGNPQKALDLITAGFTALVILGMKKQSLNDLLEKHIPDMVKNTEEFIAGVDYEIV